MKAIDPPSCPGLEGRVLNESCPTCGHMVAAHIWPTAICTMCFEEDRYAELEARITALENKP